MEYIYTIYASKNQIFLPGIKNFEIQDDGISLLSIWLDSIFWTMIKRKGGQNFKAKGRTLKNNSKWCT